MEKLAKNLIVTLDNNENYFVASTTHYNDELYGLLINVNKDSEYITVKLVSEDEIQKINDEDLLNELYPLFNNNF